MSTEAAGADGRAAAAGIRRGASYIPELESLRGLAILLVVWFHFEGILYLPLARPQSVLWPPQAFVRAGHTGVSLFFVLSAFLLSLPFLSEPRGGPYLSIGHYFRRRALRILPLYWTAVAVGAALAAHEAGDLRQGLPYLFFLNAWPGMAERLMGGYSDVWWSLATEVQFYFVLPLVLLCRRLRGGGWLAAALLAGSLTVYVLFERQTIHAATLEGQLLLGDSILGRGPQFLIGGLAAWLYLRLRTYAGRSAPAWWRLGGADAALFVTLLALAYLLRWVIEGGGQRFLNVPTQAWHVPEAALWAAIVLLVLLAPLRTKRLWSNAWLERLGLLSYSLYMWHVPLAVGVNVALIRLGLRGLPGWNWMSGVQAVGMGALCVAVSGLTYRYIERPFLTRKARLS